MSFSLKVDRRKLDALCKRVPKFNGMEIEVGFFEEDKYGPENGNHYVATVAAYNEFGTTLNPTRPFMQEMFGDAMNQLHMAWGLKKIAMSLLTNGQAVQRLTTQLGQLMVDMMQVSIDDYPGSNSARWATVKGFNDPLVHTGKMLDSVKFVVNKPDTARR